MSAGPFPGVQVVKEIYPGRIRIIPQALYGLNTFDDGQWFNFAANYLMNTYAVSGQSGGSGFIECGPWAYNIQSQITLPEHLTGTNDIYSIQPVSLRGVRGSTLFMSTAPVCIYKHRTHMWGAVQNNNPNFLGMGGFIRDITIDMQNAPANSVGIDYGDNWGGLIDVCIKNAVDPSGNGTCVGFHQANRVAWTEKCQFRLHMINNDTHILRDVITATGGSNSGEYTEWDCYFWSRGSSTKPSQIGMRLTNGFFQGGGSIRLRGNAQITGGTTPGYFLGCDGSDGSGGFSQIFNTFLDIVLESNGNANNPYLINLGGSSNQIRGFGSGIVAQFGNWSTSQLNGGQFSYVGKISGDSVLTTPNFSLPGSGTQITYRGPDAVLYSTGGTITQILVNGVSIPVGTTMIPIRDGMTLKWTYSVAPTITAVGMNI